MTLQIKDANSQIQNISTQTDAQGNLTPVNVPGSVVNSTAVPTSAANPLPVISTAGVAASDGSGTITAGGSAQNLFGGVVPVNGFTIQNNSTAVMWVSDVGAAAANGSSFQIAANGGIFTTPPGYKPAGAVSLFGGTTGQAFAARRW